MIILLYWWDVCLIYCETYSVKLHAANSMSAKCSATGVFALQENLLPPFSHILHVNSLEEDESPYTVRRRLKNDFLQAYRGRGCKPKLEDHRRGPGCHAELI